MFLPASSYQIRAGLSFLFMFLVIFSVHFKNVKLGIFILSALACFLFGGHLFNKALEDIKKFKFTFNTLASISILSGLLFSCMHLFLTVKTIGAVNNLFIITVLNVAVINMVYASFAKEGEGTQAFIGKVEDVLPKSARRVVDDEEKKIFASEIKRGDILLVKSGEVIPTDGFIVKGKTEIEETIITGNAMPAAKCEGENVYGGTINKLKDIYIEAGCILSQSEIFSIVKNLKNSELKKSLNKNPLDRYAKTVGLPILIGILVFCLLAAYKNSFSNLEYYLSLILFLFALACPPAFALCFSLSSYFGRKGAAGNNILIQNRNSLKTFKEADLVFFDKTGTITNGILEVSDVFPIKADNKTLILKYALTAEQSMTDAYSQALKRYCAKNNITPDAITSLEVLPGSGVKAKSGKNTILVGNQNWIIEEGIKAKELNRGSDNEIIICVALNKEFLGFITLTDEIRAGAVETVEWLKSEGKEIVLISGDGSKTVSYISGLLGGVPFHSSILPEAKAAMVRKSQAEGRKVVMVGDGFNDVLALLEADASLSYKSSSSAHSNWVDILVDRKDMFALMELKKLFKIVNGNILENICISLIFNVLLIAFLLNKGLVTPFLVAIFGVIGIIAVIINSARLVKIKL
ncbi:Cation transport ATPase [Elusimicrobium minutum Pei191]|uniref:Cation transport ATPase n=2 Tax=Elusimicrobium TaxID=423604 RepID=B2KDU7_ELUMP|nr:Cation transport ATPase [Elusimicrobium minutum Pei191]